MRSRVLARWCRLEPPCDASGAARHLRSPSTRILLHLVPLLPSSLLPPASSLKAPPPRAKVEGSCSGQYGFVICVTEVKEIGKGRIREGAGLVTFPIKFAAIVFRCRPPPVFPV